ATLLRRLCAHAAMCAFGIDELRQHPAEVLLLWRHAEEHALDAHVPVESLDIGDSETQFDLPRWIFVGSRVQRESSFVRHELAPARRFELELEAEHITEKRRLLPKAVRSAGRFRLYGEGTIERLHF